MADKLISTIIPVYNGERFLRDALNSVLAQTWPQHEVIVVNDGATDSSADILDEYKNHIHIITQKNAGIAAARNTGIAAAKGAFIALIDQDDMWDSQKLERQMAYFDAHPNAHILITYLRHMLQEGMGRPFWLKPELLEKELPGYLPSTMLVRREMYEIVGLYNSEYTLTDDGKWLFDAKDMGYAIHVLPETLVTRRIHDSDAAACSGVNDGCFIDLYQPTVITGTSETDAMFIDSLIAGDTGSDFFDRSKRSLARGQTMGDGVGFRLRANYSIAAQIPDFDANAGKEVCKTVEYDETVCDEDDFGRQTVGDVGNSESKKCYVIKKTKKVCEKPTPKTEFLCREYYNRSGKDVFIPAETDLEYQSFITAVTQGEIQDVSILECQRKFTPWVGITTCAAVNPACDQVVTIAAERKCQRSTSAYGSCDECAQYGAADNERIPGHPANTCYFSKECRGEPCPTGNGGENFCLVADTKIALADGTEKDILDVKIGDLVKVFDSKDALKEVKTAKVKSVMITGDQQPIALNDLKITAIHKVILEGGKQVEAKDVKIGDKIVKADGTLLEVTKITKDLKPVTVYNLDVEGFDGYIAGGLRVMDYPAPDSK